jgi:hypothetical protein
MEFASTQPKSAYRACAARSAPRGLVKYKSFETRVGGFWLYSCGFNRQATQKAVPNQKILIYSGDEMLDF